MTVLSGGLGGARLALAAVESGTAAGTTFVTNVADDWTVGDLPVCPDTDAVIYALSGRFDEQRGWGVAGDEFPGPRAGEPRWFGIGRADRATHEQRRALLAGGASPAEATGALARAAGVESRVVPVTCDPIRTRVRSGGSWLAFQEWLVRDHAPAAEGVVWEGAEHATASPGVVDAIGDADLVVLASSSPAASLAPMLAVAEVRQALARRPGPTLALSPMALARRPESDRDRRRDNARRMLMTACGIDYTPAAVARWLGPLVTHVAIEPGDAHLRDAVAETGAAPLLAPVIGIDPSERAQLIDLFGRLAAGAVGASSNRV